MLNKVVYTLCLINALTCLVIAPFQLFYVTIILQWQDHCSLYTLLVSIWCSVVFTLVAILHLYVVYNKLNLHYSGLRKNMRVMVLAIFGVFAQIILILFVRFRLEADNRVAFRHAINHYYSNYSLMSDKDYVDSTQSNGQCCGYFSKYDWDASSKNYTLPITCCSAAPVAKHCFEKDAFNVGCRTFFSHEINHGTYIPLIVSGGLLVTSLILYITLMTYLQFSGISDYERLPNVSEFDSSIAEGTHQSWRSTQSKSSLITADDPGPSTQLIV